MTITTAQTKALFKENYQMAIPRPTLLQIQNEGITMFDDLADFDKETLQKIADNLKRPGDRITDPNYIPIAPMSVPARIVPTVPTPTFTFGANSQKRLQVPCDFVHFYKTFGQPLTEANVQWNT